MQGGGRCVKNVPKPACALCQIPPIPNAMERFLKLAKLVDYWPEKSLNLWAVQKQILDSLQNCELNSNKMHKICLPGRAIWDWHPPVGEPRPLLNHPASFTNSQTPSVKDLKTRDLSHRAINPKRGYHFYQAVIVTLSWKCLDCVSLLWLCHILYL